MYTQDDLIDLLMSHLAGPRSGAQAPQVVRGRLFLSEYDIKKRLTAGGRRLTLPKDAIISPLAGDWLVLNGVEVHRE